MAYRPQPLRPGAPTIFSTNALYIAQQAPTVNKNSDEPTMYIQGRGVPKQNTPSTPAFNNPVNAYAIRISKFAGINAMALAPAKVSTPPTSPFVHATWLPDTP